MRAAVQRLVLGGLAGKLLGMLREVLLAAAYGTGIPATATRVAQTGTLMPVDFFTADVLTAGFLPLHKELLSTDPARAATLFHGLRTALWVLSGILTVGLLVFARPAVDLLAPGLDAEAATASAEFLRVMAVGIPSYLQFSLLSYLEISHDGFRLSSARATAQNLGMLASLGLAWLLHRPVVLAGVSPRPTSSCTPGGTRRYAAAGSCPRSRGWAVGNCAGGCGDGCDRCCCCPSCCRVPSSPSGSSPRCSGTRSSPPSTTPGSWRARE